MQEKIRQRLQSLKTEYEAGQRMLAGLEAKQANLRDTLLRISGAIQVLEELANAEDSPSVIPAEAKPVQTVVEADRS
ncbi:hypothetical protein [Nodosilinea sp. FACHB-13]|uniref:hypothetical protein n=1 Tax=Cyanophyceae TaxID=3028117 RepID=UPI001682852F|nr:hypothetical protein [Nodosilinea sp. FACHB-13]MBD2110041.1 hypothetical protein [Nodosilinea sp. FACHB-13]